jgi:hypothetical protein
MVLAFEDQMPILRWLAEKKVFELSVNKEWEKVEFNLIEVWYAKQALCCGRKYEKASREVILIKFFPQNQGEEEEIPRPAVLIIFYHKCLNCGREKEFLFLD